MVKPPRQKKRSTATAAFGKSVPDDRPLVVKWYSMTEQAVTPRVASSVRKRHGCEVMERPDHPHPHPPSGRVVPGKHVSRYFQAARPAS